MVVPIKEILVNGKLIQKSKSRIDALVRRVPLAIVQLEIPLIVQGNIGQTKGLAGQHDEAIN